MDFFTFVIILVIAAAIMNILIGKSKKSKRDLQNRRKDIINRQKDIED